MNFKQLFTEDRAVSPVIGVILMVAITVILAAVIGTFVLGLGDQVSQSAPQAQFTFEFTDGASNETISVTHDGGDAVEADQLSINVAGTEIWTNSTVSGWSESTDNWNGEVSAGDGLELESDSNDAATSGDAVRVIWSSSNSDKTATIGQAEFSA